MNQNDFRKLQLAQLDIMDEIHRICTEVGISYSLGYGSTLGAIRHQGFIPWDFDIDCIMPRLDYIRFKEACLESLSDRFVYYDYTIVSNYTRPHALVCIKNSKLLTKYDKYNQGIFSPGIFVDIFPLDITPDDIEERKRHSETIQKIKRKIYVKRRYKYNPSFVSKAGKFIRSLPLSFESLDSLNKSLDEEMQQFSSKKTGYVCSMVGNYPYERESFPKSWFGVPRLAAFEGRKFYIPQEAEQYLQKLYGDYMTLPPEEKRVANIDYFEYVEFDREYQNA